jgi:hypothetical protein
MGTPKGIEPSIITTIVPSCRGLRALAGHSSHCQCACSLEGVMRMHYQDGRHSGSHDFIRRRTNDGTSTVCSLL